MVAAKLHATRIGNVLLILGRFLTNLNLALLQRAFEVHENGEWVLYCLCGSGGT